MPQLIWDPLDFLTVLAVEPVEEEYGISHHYRRETTSRWLLVTVWQDESRIAMSIGQVGHTEPIFSFTAFVRDRVIRHETRELEWLELRDVILAPLDLPWFETKGLFDRERRPESYNLSLWVTPEIQLSFTR